MPRAFGTVLSTSVWPRIALDLVVQRCSFGRRRAAKLV